MSSLSPPAFSEGASQVKASGQLFHDPHFVLDRIPLCAMASKLTEWDSPLSIAAHLPPCSCITQAVTTLLAVGSAVSILPPILRKALPENLLNLPVSAPLDAGLANVFPEVRRTHGMGIVDHDKS